MLNTEDWRSDESEIVTYFNLISNWLILSHETINSHTSSSFPELLTADQKKNRVVRIINEEIS